MQLIYVVEGSVEIYLDEETKIYNKGDLIILNQFENKFIYSREENVLFISKISSEYLKSLGKIYYTSRFVNKSEDKRNNDNILKNMINIYKKLNNKENKENGDMNLSLIQQILLILIKNYICIECTLTNIDEKSDCLLSLETFVENENPRELNLINIAEEMHLSSSYLSKTFNELSGINFSEFIQQLKLFYSTTYLLNTKDTLEQISYTIGFESIKSLIRIYKKFFNMTPTEYRKKYVKSFDYLDDNINFVELLNQYQNLKYDQFINNFGNRIKSNYNIDVNAKKQGEFFKQWRIIRNLKSLGNNYLSNLDELLKNYAIDEMIILFSVDENGELIILDLNRQIDEIELMNLLSKCIENNIMPVIGLEFEEKFSKNNIEELIYERLTKIKKFYDLISNAIGITNMKKFTFLLNIGSMTDYLDDEEKLERYREYIIKQQRMLEDKLETHNYKWGYNLGRISEDKIFKIGKILDRFKGKKFKFVPTVVYLTVVYLRFNKENIKNKKELINIKKELNHCVNGLTQISKEFNFLVDKVYVKDLFLDIDISDVNYLYRDLFAVSLILDSIFANDDKDIKYIYEYKLTDKLQKDGIYLPRYTDENGFNTPVYWISLLLDSIKGEVIYDEQGCFAVINDADLYILLYGDTVTDYYFAQKNGIQDLDEKYLDINLNIKGLKGKYKITTERLSYKEGTIGYYLKHFENYKYLTSKEKEYIKRVAVPSLDINLKEISNEYVDIVKYSPFNVVLKKYTKI
ncbi:AraC family transcriptional regulator [Peptoniphilus stercorisuis]|uniref:AraC-like DNA-binding protein n=1 Tax=Peptoniphilus stercorisuis TaxID=1436965 RepID=A0ABS4KAG6_9FIRM|nr:AraC family transcriptional regulator [Peptoniphilus stercorisuis]MBP2024768.1 AraC-like DNA-binding protein [Peptoniphilus stercorisuis]